MPSVDLQACESELREAFLRGKRAYEQTFPGRVLRVTCTHRSEKEQWAAWVQGRKCINPARPWDAASWIVDDDPKTFIVTKVDGQTVKGKHNVLPSRAIDFVVTVAGKLTWREGPYIEAGPYFESEGLRWGGNWDQDSATKDKWVDYPHVELP